MTSPVPSPYGTRGSASSLTLMEQSIPIPMSKKEKNNNNNNNNNNNSYTSSSFLSTSNSKLNQSSTSLNSSSINSKSSSRKSGATISSSRRLSISSNSSTLPGISLGVSIGSSSSSSASTSATAIKLAKAALKRSIRLGMDLELDDADDGEVKSDKLTLKEKRSLFECELCSKVYRHSTCLVKHRWEHTAHWKEASKLLLSKHEQTKLLEASAILTALTAGSSLPDEKSYWPAAVSPASSGLLGSQSLNISVLTSPRSNSINAFASPHSLRSGFDHLNLLSSSSNTYQYNLNEVDENEKEMLMGDEEEDDEDLENSIELSPDLENDENEEQEEGIESEESVSTADDLAEGMFDMEIETELSNGTRSGSSVLGEDLDEKGYSSGGGGHNSSSINQMRSLGRNHNNNNGSNLPPLPPTSIVISPLGKEAESLGLGLKLGKVPALGFFPIAREVNME